MTVWHGPPSNYTKQLDLYTEYAEDLNADSKFAIDNNGDTVVVDEMWGVSEYDHGIQDAIVIDAYDNCIHDTVDIDHSIQDSFILKDLLGDNWEIKDPVPPSDCIVIKDFIYLEGISPPDIDLHGTLTVGNGGGLTIADNNEVTITFPYMEEMHEYQKIPKIYNKHLAHVIQKLKSELIDEVDAIGEGKCKSELIEEKIDWFINLLRKE